MSSASVNLATETALVRVVLPYSGEFDPRCSYLPRERLTNGAGDIMRNSAGVAWSTGMARVLR